MFRFFVISTLSFLATATLAQAAVCKDELLRVYANGGATIQGKAIEDAAKLGLKMLEKDDLAQVSHIEVTQEIDNQTKFFDLLAQVSSRLSGCRLPIYLQEPEASNKLALMISFEQKVAGQVVVNLSLDLEDLSPAFVLDRQQGLAALTRDGNQDGSFYASG